MAYSFHNQNMSTISNILNLQFPLKANLLLMALWILSATIKKGR